jgi:RNA 2',3'-cyclic 3'-phosphodiesterase
VTRAFVAVKLPLDVLSAVQSRTSGLEIRGGRVTPVLQWHLTLQFLGNDADLDAVIAALDGFDVAGGRVRLGGAGGFPNARRGRILWIGVAEGADVFARLAGGVARRLAPFGFEPDTHEFRPHLTLARYPSPTDLRVPVAALGAESFGGSWRVDELTVFESQLRDDGPRYLERATVPLPG